jgi:hypothetical protein
MLWQGTLQQRLKDVTAERDLAAQLLKGLNSKVAVLTAQRWG